MFLGGFQEGSYMILDTVIAVSICAFVAAVLGLILFVLFSLSNVKKRNSENSDNAILDDKSMKMLTPDKEDLQAMESGVSFERAFVRCRATNSDIEKLFTYKGSPDCKSIMNSFRVHKVI